MLVQNNKRNYTFFYLLLLLLFVISYFEYFFRGSGLLMLGIEIVSMIFGIGIVSKEIGSPSNRIPLYFIIGTFFVCSIQLLLNTSASIFFPISQVVMLVSLLIIGLIVKERILESFVYIMALIAFYSIIIYVICLLFPSVKDYLINNISPKFVSLGAEHAIQEGGGINFIIYNFQTDSPWIKISRNCGPFWEPGMFAVFLDLALFINLFIIRRLRLLNILFIGALITTFSTGGLMGGFFILGSYSLINNRNVFLAVISIIIIIILIPYYFDSDFLGVKLLGQLSDTEIGSDRSRFGALLTHLKIFEDHPLWGHFGLKGYVQYEGDTLASGLLVPLSSRGIFVGGLYYYLLYKSSINYSLYYTNQKKAGTFLFVLILVLSISQTILMTSCFLVYIFAGQLINRNRVNEYTKV